MVALMVDQTVVPMAVVSVEQMVARRAGGMAEQTVVR